jgi:hypothetical protein
MMRSDSAGTFQCRGRQRLEPLLPHYQSSFPITLVTRSQQAKEQSSCSEWTGIPLQTEHCCADWEPLRCDFWAEPRRVICLSGAEVVRRMASRKPREGPMTRTKSKRETATHSRPVKTAKRKSSRRPVPVGAASRALPKRRAGTKHSQVVAMLKDRAGTTIAAIMAATGWQQHSVRGFLAGVIRKRLGLNLVSEPGEGGRVYRIIDETVSPAKADRVKQAA